MATEFIEIDDSPIAEGGVTEGTTNDYDRVWDDLQAACDAQTNVSGLVVDAVKGGLVVDMGVRGFIPKSQIATRNLNNLERYIGQPIEARVLEIDREKGRVLLSERKVAEEKRLAERAATLSAITIGQTITGTVRRITEFGAFVDIGGIDGLLHVSDMAWERVEKPEEIVKVDDEIEVKVLKIERDGERISLGLKQLTDDPWTIARNDIKVGQVLEVEIIRLEKFGAIVKVLDGVEGVIPNRELSEKRIETPEGVVEVGQTVTAKLIEFRQRERRITLSIREAARASERQELHQFMTKQKEEYSTPTLGDLFGDVFSKFKKD
ncbi:MAG TPA: S1 RNA-binding domain-containing protein [Armatimonadota bacterium]|jgi:ribosomal protein S1